MTSLAEALRIASEELDEWHIAHQGSLRDIVGRVWWCGDDVCDCTEAQIVARFRNKVDPRFVVPRILWRGEFHTDGEAGADRELAARRAEVEADEPELSIVWL